MLDLRIKKLRLSKAGNRISIGGTRETRSCVYWDRSQRRRTLPTAILVS